MKFTIILFCFVLLTNAEYDKEFVEKMVKRIKTVMQECAVETKASPDDIKTLIDHKIPETHEGQCLIFCFHRKFEIQNDDGSVNKEKAIEAFGVVQNHSPEVHAKVLQVMDKCTETVAANSDPCVYGAELAKCSQSEGKNVGLKLDEIVKTT